jgi:aspartyl-tRNA(Asn)/glutamyl-tRNA(Gln) amidotransferase subunit B
LEYFAKTVAIYPEAKKVASLMEEFLLPASLKEETPVLDSNFPPERLARLGELLDQGVLGRRVVQEIFGELFLQGLDPLALAQEKNLIQVTDQNALATMAAQVVAEHPAEVAKYLAGQEKIMGFLVGQMMRKSRGTANPKGVQQALSEAIKAEENNASR